MTVREFSKLIEEEGWVVAHRELEKYDDYTDWERNEDLVKSVINSDLVSKDDDVKEIVDKILRYHIATYTKEQDFLEDSVRNMDIENVMNFIDWNKLEDALDYDYKLLYGECGEVFVFEP